MQRMPGSNHESAQPQSNLTSLAVESSILGSPRIFGLFLAIGYLTLSIIHWQHSWGALSQGFVFADLGDSQAASPLLEICQTVTLSFLFALYLTRLFYWDRWKVTPRQICWLIVVGSLLAWSALPANST